MSMATRSPRSTRKPRPWRWTRAHLERLPRDGNRYEVLDGALLVTPQARLSHQGIAAALIRSLDPYCAANGLGIALGPGAVIWDDNELQPDIEVLPMSHEQVLTGTWETVPLPRLVIEILSPDSARHDLHRKRAAYLALGIPEYWVVDGEAKRVLVFRPGQAEPRVVTDVLTWAPRESLAPLSIELRTIVGA